MRYSYNWLKEISKTKKDIEELGKLITEKVFEVEEIQNLAGTLNNIIVGKIVEIKKHPNADDLSLVKLAVGNEKFIEVVCGAKNINIGDLVPVALLGAKLMNGEEVQEREIRGVKSKGMLCAQDELGLGSDHKGIMILDKKARIGMKLNEYLEVDDKIMDIDILSNRASDAMSHIGLAREIAAISGEKLKIEEKKLPAEKNNSNELSVKIEEKEICSRYIAAKLSGVKVTESPEWIKSRLISSGVRPINNLVDITNFVMLELGQPMHAFSFEEIGKEIIVRRAKAKEKLELLDGSILELDKEDVLITSPGSILGLAGVMGAKKSAIEEKTTTIILESATFNPVSVRRTRIRYGLPTEAAMRFEKNLDPNLAEKAAARAIELFSQVCGAKVEAIEDIYPSPVNSWEIKLELSYIDSLLGEKIESKKSKVFLENLGMEIRDEEDHFLVTVPTFRLDLKTPEDLIEEIGRIYGYEKIKKQPLLTPIKRNPLNKKLLFERKLKNTLVDFGFWEVYNYSFYSKKDAQKFNLSAEKHLELENPMNPEQELMRTTLAPGILKKISQNLKYFENPKVFEIANIFKFKENNYTQEEKLAAGISKELDKDKKIFFELKGYLEGLLKKINIDSFEFLPNKETSFLAPGKSADILVENKKIGEIGEVKTEILSFLGIKKPTAFFELDMKIIKDFADKKTLFKNLPKYPSVKRDISILVPREISYAEIVKDIRNSSDKALSKLELFDVFEKNQEKSFAFHLEFSSDKKTLTSQEADEILQKIINNLERRGVKTRK